MFFAGTVTCWRGDMLARYFWQDSDLRWLAGAGAFVMSALVGRFFGNTCESIASSLESSPLGMNVPCRRVNLAGLSRLSNVVLPQSCAIGILRSANGSAVQCPLEALC